MNASDKMLELDLDLTPQEVSTDVLLEKYARDGERSVQEVRRRVARGLAACEAPAQHLLHAALAIPSVFFQQHIGRDFLRGQVQVQFQHLVARIHRLPS
ncbi:MAG: hypothetical protein ACO1N5_07240, partial [Noviherbaspirillum sp.]